MSSLYNRQRSGSLKSRLRSAGYFSPGPHRGPAPLPLPPWAAGARLVTPHPLQNTPPDTSRMGRFPLSTFAGKRVPVSFPSPFT